MKLKWSKEKTILALKVSAIVTLPLAFEAAWMSQSVRSGERESVEKSLATSAQRFASAFRAEMSRYRDPILETGRKMRDLISANPSALAKSGLLVTLQEIIPEIYDVALWKPLEPAGAFDLDQQVRRIHWVQNSRYNGLSAELSRLSASTDETERLLVKTALQGHSIAAGVPATLGQGNIAIIALPLAGEVAQVVTSHIRLDHLQQVMPSESRESVILTDDFGNVLAYPNAKAGVHFKVNTTPLFQAFRSSKETWGSLYFSDEKDHRLLGAFSRADLRLGVLTSVSESEALPLSSTLRTYTLWISLGIFSLVFSATYFLAPWITRRMAWLQAGANLDEDLKQEPNLSPQAKKWLVNNGSQIIGPLSASDIAARLFAQELDFDCECWEEGGGAAGPIQSAGMFSGSDDEGATFWVYDGETIHGPISAGFINTALKHHAMSDDAHVCEKSTIQGWKPMEQWKSEQPTKDPSDVQDSEQKAA